MNNYDEQLIQQAIEIAMRSIESEGGPFGALITLDNKVIASAGNSVVKDHDPTAHAEILAIRKASSILGSHNLSDCVLYSSCEPCPMCLGAIYWSGIRRVVFSADRRDAAASGFNDEIIYTEIVLPPEKRIIEFVKLNCESGRSLFEFWDKYPGKVHY